LGQKEGGGGGRKYEKGFSISKTNQTNEFKQMNSNTQNSAPACMQQEIPIFHY
jgi:hypothetical protein